VHVVSAAESAARDRAAIDAGIPSRALMRAAGMAAASTITRRLSARLAGGIAVFAGPGNNGGDAWVVAGALAAIGATVRVAAVGPTRAGDAAAERAAAEPLVAPGAPQGTETLVVDGLLGTGATGTPRGAIAEAIKVIADARARGAIIVALDVPSGVDATTGASTGAVTADLTLTFGSLKRGLTIARTASGHTIVLDIGLGRHAAGTDAVPTLIDAAYARVHVPPIAAEANKGSRHRIAIIAGGPGMAGAAVLAARSALASGIGLVKLFVAPTNVPVVQTAAYEALAHPWPTTAAEVEREIDDWADAALIGPGIGTGAAVRSMVERVLGKSRLPLVIDADGLNLFAGRTASLARLLGERPSVITPHPGEFGRLTKQTIDAVLDQRFDVGAPLASELGATILLKGVPTVITGPDGTRFVSAAGTPVLATGGSGDVLSGIVTTLLAQTRDPLASAASAAWIHGAAAELAGHGRVRGVTLDKVVAALPDAWNIPMPVRRYPVLAELPAVGDRT
jgi:hydroxyethylthiazole kinase-like uncharacterized protein yjeF